MVIAFVSMMDSMISLPAEFITAIEIVSCERPSQRILHFPLQVSFALEANARNLHQTGRAFIMRLFEVSLCKIVSYVVSIRFSFHAAAELCQALSAEFYLSFSKNR